MSDTTIRKAEQSDVAQLVALGKAMHELSQYRDYNFSESILTATLRGLINDEDGLAVVASKNGVIVGGMIGQIGFHFFGADRVATDMALFIAPEERKGRIALKLISKWIEVAKEKGANQISIANSTGYEMEKVKALYEIAGFQHIGYVFQMRCK